MTLNSVKILLLAGRSGVGKTTVGYEVSEQLRNHDVAHALVDGDNLDEVYPEASGSELAEANLAAIWRNYRARSLDRLIYVNTVSVLEREMITRAVGGEVEVTGILLTASDVTAGVRLQQREIGSTLDVHLKRSRDAAAHLDTAAGAWVHRVPTDGRSVKEVAQSIIRHTGWVADGE